MKLLVTVYVVLTLSLTQALPTDDDQADLVFSEENKVENIEEQLFVYAELLKGLNQKSGIGNEVADDQTNPHCTDPECTCALKYRSFSANSGTCTVENVPYCEGVCQANYKYGSTM